MARRSAKLIANFSATMVTSLPSFSLSLSLSVSLSLSPNVPHAQYRKRFRASYNNVLLIKQDKRRKVKIADIDHLCSEQMGSIHLYFARKQVGDTPKRGKPEMRSSCRNSLDLHCSAEARPGRGSASVPHLGYLSVSRHFNE